MKKFSLPGTLCKNETVGKGERFLGYLVGPLGFGFLSIMVNSYLNVYYTDVCGLGRLWGGSFMSVYPILVKGLDVLTYLAAGWLVDRTVTTQGKARPYLLLSGALLPWCPRATISSPLPPCCAATCSSSPWWPPCTAPPTR